MKKLFFIPAIILLGITKPICSQELEDHEEVRRTLNHIFAKLDKSRVPTGLLLDYAFDLIDLDRFNGKELTDSNYVRGIDFEYILRTIRSAAVITPPFGAVSDLLENQYKKGDTTSEQVTILGIALFQYSQIRRDAWEKKLIRYENEQIYDNLADGVWRNPYEQADVFAFYPRRNLFKGKDIKFNFSDRLWLTNLSFKSIRFDADDGKGYLPIKKGEIITISYPSTGIKHLKLQVELLDGRVLSSHSLIEIETSNLKTRSSSPLPDKIEKIQLPNTAGQISYLYACGRNRLTKPFIVIEGFNPPEFGQEEGYDPHIYPGITNLKNFLQKIEAENSHITHLLRGEYDIVYVDLLNSYQSIQENAKLFQQIIHQINVEKKRNGSNHPNIIMGQSMGGLIARYGLRKMEMNRETHETSVFITHDTPHLGANIPVGFQYLAIALSNFYREKKILNWTDPGNIQKKIHHLLHASSVKQMLINYINENGDLDTSVHQQWIRELSDLGYPQGDPGRSIKLLGISNGKDQITPQKSMLLELKGEVNPSFLTETFFHTIHSPISFLTQDLSVHLLSFIAGKSSFGTHIYVGFTNDNRACDFQVTFKKKVAWLVPIQKTIFRYSRKTPTHVLNLDRGFGSYTGINMADLDKKSNFGIDLIAAVKMTLKVEDKFLFIPTVSALDKNRGKKPLTPADYQESIILSDFSTAPNEFPFDDIYISDNAKHIFFDAGLLEWILRHLQPDIMGPKVIGEKANFTVINAPQNIRWSTSDPSLATIDEQGTVTRKGHGVGYVIAEFTRNNIPMRLTKQVLFGIPLFILKKLPWVFEGKHQVTAELVSPEYKAYLPYINFEWKIKEKTSSEWETSAGCSQTFQTTNSQNHDAKATVYMRPYIENGDRGNLVHLPLNLSMPFRVDPQIIITENDNLRNWQITISPTGFIDLTDFEIYHITVEFKKTYSGQKEIQGRPITYNRQRVFPKDQKEITFYAKSLFVREEDMELWDSRQIDPLDKRYIIILTIKTNKGSYPILLPIH